MFLKKYNLKNKIALVSGAGKGLGRACAIALAEAGTYLIKWSCPAYGRNYHQSRLRNVTDGSSVGGTGASTYADYDSNVQNESVGVQRLTISSAKAFEVQHRCSVSGAHNDGFGVKTNFSTDNEIYTIVEIYKEA